MNRVRTQTPAHVDASAKPDDAPCPTSQPHTARQWFALALEHAPFLAAFCVAVFMLTINVALPWASIHEDNGLVFESIGVNYLRFGLGFAKGQNVADTVTMRNLAALPGIPSAQQFAYLRFGPVVPEIYAHHPPLFGLTVAGSLLVFGFHWWAVRLVPIAYSLAGLIVFYALMRSLFSEQRRRLVAWVACGLYVTFPILAYYGRNVAHESAVLFWTLLLLTGYFRWRRDGRTRWLALMALSVAIGVAYDWPMCYFAVLLFAIHWATTRRFSRPLFLASVVVAVGAFALVMAQIAWALDGNLHGILAMFLERSGGQTAESYTLALWIRQVLRFNAEDYGFVTAALVPVIAIFVAQRARAEGWSPRIQFVVLTAAFGLSHMLIFSQGAFVHDYWQFYLLPCYACAVGWAVVALVRRFISGPRVAGVALVAIVLASFALNFPEVHSLYSTGSHAFVPITHVFFAVP